MRVTPIDVNMKDEIVFRWMPKGWAMYRFRIPHGQQTNACFHMAGQRYEAARWVPANWEIAAL